MIRTTSSMKRHVGMTKARLSPSRQLGGRVKVSGSDIQMTLDLRLQRRV